MRGEAAVVLGLRTPDLVDPARSLFNIGMDSLMAIELKSRLERAVAAPLPSALALTIRALTLGDFLDTTIVGFTPARAVELEDADEI